MNVLSAFPEAWIQPWFSTWAFVWGACMGSFANVCIYRMPLDLSVVTPRSFCPRCRHPIAWYENIPLLGFLLLRARCRHCGERIAGRYFLVELLTAVLFLLVWRIYGFDLRTLVFWGVVTALVIGSFIDFDHMIIPDRITIGGMLTGPLLSLLIPALHQAESPYLAFRASAIGLVLGAVLLYGVAVLGRILFKKEAMGMGDVKLLSAIGAYMGWKAIIFTVFVSSVTGALVGLSFVALRLKKMESRIPFGPYIALAAVLWILCGEAGWNAYFNWLMPSP